MTSFTFNQESSRSTIPENKLQKRFCNPNPILTRSPDEPSTSKYKLKPNNCNPIIIEIKIIK
jgi:hypothetical protein